MQWKPLAHECRIWESFWIGKHRNGENRSARLAFVRESCVDGVVFNYGESKDRQMLSFVSIAPHDENRIHHSVSLEASNHLITSLPLKRVRSSIPADRGSGLTRRLLYPPLLLVTSDFVTPHWLVTLPPLTCHPLLTCQPPTDVIPTTGLSSPTDMSPPLMCHPQMFPPSDLSLWCVAMMAAVTDPLLCVPYDFSCFLLLAQSPIQTYCGTVKQIDQSS